MWFHCASVGEYEQARPVMEAWRSLHPGDAFLLSFYSASGWEAFARRQPEWWTAADHVTAMPLDVRASMRLFVQAAGGAERLRGLLFAKYDVWPTLVAELIRLAYPSVCLLAMSCQGGGRFDGAEATSVKRGRICAVFGCRPRLPCQPCPLMV